VARQLAARPQVLALAIKIGASITQRRPLNSAVQHLTIRHATVTGRGFRDERHYLSTLSWTGPSVEFFCDIYSEAAVTQVNRRRYHDDSTRRC